MDIAAGSEFACGVRPDGTAVCWGLRTSRDLEPPDRKGFIKISSGEQHVCALRADGIVVCWGEDYTGQTNPPDEFKRPYR
ncbi:MAG: hypothetical protein F4X65_02765 [Chloroflexi bacterium]|nr:hypothetical protein [Chloroflexota bacterium]